MSLNAITAAEVPSSELSKGADTSMADENSAYAQKSSGDVTDAGNGKSGKSARNSVNSESRVGSLFSIMLVSVLAAALLGAVIFSLNRRNTMYSEVTSLTEELTLAEAENVRLQSELESKISAKNVEDYVENVLGMQKIDSSQIKYIRIQTNDVVSIPQQDESVLSKIRSFFDRCVEYFRG